MGQSEYKIGGNAYRLSICDHILDNGYGQVGLTNVERKLERLPLFKRLHNISQLGLVNWIFPCALHTRYTHSIGVMHVAGQMAAHININYGSTFFDDSDIQIIRIAGMLHDIGHYPLSHNVEQAYKDINAEKKFADEKVVEHLKEYLNCPNFLDPMLSSTDVILEESEKLREGSKNRENYFKNTAGSTGYHHENIGKELICNNNDIARIVRENFVLMPDTSQNDEFVLNPKFASAVSATDKKISAEAVDVLVKTVMRAIAYIVAGDYAYNGEKLPWIEKYSAMVQIIHSELDADNLDYLLRDASFSGTSYGVMDMGVLLNALTVVKLENRAPNSHDAVPYKYIVGMKPKGVGCVEQFLLNKYLAYSQMTFSKYVSILEAMLLRVVKDIIPTDSIYKGPELLKMSQSKETQETYLAYTDSYIMRKIPDLEKVINVLSPLSQAIISCLKSYSAFNLKMSRESECFCTGFTEEEIAINMKKSKVYDRFSNVCERNKNLCGREFKNTNQEKTLFSYRFEQYALTKQLPIEKFMDIYDLSLASAETRFTCHYYRLGNGIPVLDDGKAYFYQEERDQVCVESLPPLSVDCPQCSLHKIYPMQFAVLREYAVEPF